MDEKRIYSPEQLQEIREEHQQRRSRSRFKLVITTIVFFVALAVGLFFLMQYFPSREYGKPAPDPASLRNFIVISLVSVFALAAIYAGVCWFISRVICPGCSGRADKRWGPYCPECGKDGLQSITAGFGIFDKAHCDNCKKDLIITRRSSGSDYKVLHCMSCGVYLGSPTF